MTFASDKYERVPAVEFMFPANNSFAARWIGVP